MDEIVFPWTWDEEQKIKAVAEVIASGHLEELLGEKE